jgi:Hypothetical glycosyl hydrolase 6/Beta-galactosidase trimerisation domain
MAHKDFLVYRQIHLDFHTSEHIPDIGASFDPEEFADTLVKAHVNSITCFARCHHGLLYYDSKLFPERIHPHLKNKNMLKEQIEACHARGIRVPIYITVQWDYYTSERHPEWLQLEEDGRIGGTAPYGAGFYKNLLVNSPYLDFLKAHTKEVLEMLPADGFFFDIVKPLDDSSRWSKEQMLAAGLDPGDKAARREFGLQAINDFKCDMTKFVKAINPESAIFYNAGHIGPRHRPVKDAYDHFEVESLPSGHWGYLHFPMSMRYARTLGADCLAHTGKFHTAWGDFHSYKNQAALEFECYRMLALNAKCMIGDQLHPNGTLDQPAYNLIGRVYEQVEKKEAWCKGAKAVCDIAVLTPETFSLPSDHEPFPALEGITLMLEEAAQQFDVIDDGADFSAYKVIVLPDVVPVDDALRVRLETFAKAGGAIIASFASGMNREQQQFTLPLLGVSLAEGDAADMRGKIFEQGDYCEYLIPLEPLREHLVNTEYVMYTKGMPVKLLEGTNVLAEGVSSYFDRTYRHFCSHRQTPSSGEKSTPAVVQKDKVIYFAHPIFTQYRQNTPLWCKQLFLNALALVLPHPLVKHDSFSTLRATVNEQPLENRYVLHLLHYIPERRGKDFDTIEDVIPVYDIELQLQLPKKIRTVKTAPEGKDLPFEQNEQGLKLVLPKLLGHQMIALSH